MSNAASTADRPWYPTPATLLLRGLPGSLLTLWLWSESPEDDASFFGGVAAVLGLVALTLTGIRVVAQGIRVGLAWFDVDHDRATLTASRTEVCQRGVANRPKPMSADHQRRGLCSVVLACGVGAALLTGCQGAQDHDWAALATAKCGVPVADAAGVESPTAIDDSTEALRLNQGKVKVSGWVDTQDGLRSFVCVVTPDSRDKLRGYRVESVQLSPAAAADTTKKQTSR